MCMYVYGVGRLSPMRLAPASRRRAATRQRWTSLLHPSANLALQVWRVPVSEGWLGGAA